MKNELQRVGFGGGCTTCAGGVCVHGDWWQISFWCSPIVCQVLAGGDWFQCAFALLVWVVWLFRGWPRLSEGDLGCLLGSLCLVLCGMWEAFIYPVCWHGLMDDDTSSHCISCSYCC